MIPARPRQNNKKQKLVTSLVPQAKQSTSVLQNDVELGLTVRLNDLQHSPDEKDRHLLSLPARMTQALFEEFYGLYERLIESQQYEVLESPLMMQYMVFNIDEARQFQISLLVLKTFRLNMHDKRQTNSACYGPTSCGLPTNQTSASNGHMPCI